MTKGEEIGFAQSSMFFETFDEIRDRDVQRVRIAKGIDQYFNWLRKRQIAVDVVGIPSSFTKRAPGTTLGLTTVPAAPFMERDEKGDLVPWELENATVRTVMFKGIGSAAIVFAGGNDTIFTEIPIENIKKLELRDNLQE